MEFDPQEQVIVDLLGKIKNADAGYPKKLLASRRRAYLNQIANIGLGMGLGAEINNNAKTPKSGPGGSHLPAINASSIFEVLLVTAIVVEAGIAAYTYRDRIIDLFASSPSTPVTEGVASQSANESLQPNFVSSGTPSPTGTPTVTPTGTLTTTPEQPDDDGKKLATATPNPSDDNGNHFGQTAKPPKPTKDKSPKKP